MKRIALQCALLLALWVSVQPPVRADAAGELLSRYIAWRGGAAFEHLQSVHERGRIRVGEVDGTFERWLARDGRLREDRSLGPLADSTAVTPDSSWTTNASGQLEESGDHGLAVRRAIALYFADLGHARPDIRLQVLGVEQRENRPWTIVRVGFGGNDIFDLFIDASTGELLGERITQDRVTRFIRYGDWRMIGAIRFAFEQRITAADPGADETRRLDSIEVNPALAAELFARPAPKQSWSFAHERSSTGWLPFEFYNNDQIFVPASVNGHPLNLVLDSGADITILDKSVAGQIGASLSGAVPVGGTGGQSTMQLAP
ncbi:MAG: retropepsin-like domain-containing protein, partial [Proteobacteria bacterium]|nr:retropepsin-like domain-containing protein [Pseudomonadota bacterium]